MTTTPVFTPSQTDLRDMIAKAMAKCDADIDQCARRKEAREIKRMEQAWGAEARSQFLAATQAATPPTPNSPPSAPRWPERITPCPTHQSSQSFTRR